MEQDIYEKAIELGYEKCGIIPIEAMRGYGERMQERIRVCRKRGKAIEIRYV